MGASRPARALGPWPPIIKGVSSDQRSINCTGLGNVKSRYIEIVWITTAEFEPELACHVTAETGFYFFFQLKYYSAQDVLLIVEGNGIL